MSGLSSGGWVGWVGLSLLLCRLIRCGSVGVDSFNVSIWLNALGQCQEFCLDWSGEWELAHFDLVMGQVRSSGLLFCLVFYFFCWLPVAIFGQTCVREAMHGVGVGVGIGVGVGVGGASVKFSYATVDILLVFSYARNPERERGREREPLKQLDSSSSFFFCSLPVQWLSSLMRLSNGCLPSASRLACQMCQNSSVRSLLRFVRVP